MSWRRFQAILEDIECIDRHPSDTDKSADVSKDIKISKIQTQMQLNVLMDALKRRKIVKAVIAVHLTITANEIALLNLMVLQHIAKMEAFN